MPARSSVSNRNKLRQAREALRSPRPEQREELRWNGIGPGDSYIGLWRMVNRHRHRLATVQGMLDAKTLPPSRRHELEKTERYLSEQIVSIYAKLLGHEKPKLASVEFKGDPKDPLQTQIDLTCLPDEDLYALSRILPKLGGATGPDAPAGSDVDAGARGDKAPPGGAHRPK